jgi:hypothetical protein
MSGLSPISEMPTGVADVRYWLKADIPDSTANVRFWG